MARADHAGQEPLPTGGADASGNAVLSDIGLFHKQQITAHFASAGTDLTLQFLDRVHAGRPPHLSATRLLICADRGGSNGYRTRLCKTELADLASTTGLTITASTTTNGLTVQPELDDALYPQGIKLSDHDMETR